MATVLLLTIPTLGAVLAAGMDFVRFRIPNGLSIGLALLFFPAAWLLGFDIAQLMDHLQAGGLAFGLGLALFLARIWGGGDAKLFAALGLWLGLDLLLPFTFAMVLAGGLLALILLLLRKRAWPENIARHKLLRRLLGAKAAVPYAVAMAMGMLWLLARA
ncbi:MAG: prepilin peptidase [Rhodospirillales bacterium]|nr:prepilin peptidase [Rhodospirillales bacterium]